MLIPEEHFSQQKINTILEIIRRDEYINGDLSFGGSFSLYLNGLINRKIGDIDLVTVYSPHGLLEDYGIEHCLSQNSNIPGVKHYSLYVNNTNVCLFKVPALYSEIKILTYNGVDYNLRCQTPKAIIHAKNAYISIGIKKHIKDEQRFALQNLQQFM